jgi:hypothetical protein
MASLFHNKPHGKTWMLRWYVGSKQRTRSLHTTDYEVALAEKLAEEKTHPRTRIRWDRIGLDQNPRSRETVFARRHKLASFAVAVLYDEPEKFAYLLSPPCAASN